MFLKAEAGRSVGVFVLCKPGGRLLAQDWTSLAALYGLVHFLFTIRKKKKKKRHPTNPLQSSAKLKAESWNWIWKTGSKLPLEITGWGPAQSDAICQNEQVQKQPTCSSWFSCQFPNCCGSEPSGAAGSPSLGHSGIHLHDHPGLILPESTGASGKLLESPLDSHLPGLSKMGAKSWSNKVVHAVWSTGQVG